MKLLTILLLALCANLCTSVASATISIATPPQRGFPKLSPFDGVRWEGKLPEVKVDETWYEPKSIAGVELEQILTFCEQRWGADAVPKRFSEDLMEALAGLGTVAGKTVDLVLVDLATGEQVSLKDVPNTESKRTALNVSNRRRSPRTANEGPKQVRPEDARLDLEALAKHIRDSYSYRDLTGFKWEKAFERVIEKQLPKMGKAVDPSELGVAVMKLLAPFGDGHTRLAGSMAVLPKGYAPFLMVGLGDRVVALKRDGSDFYSEEYPFLLEIDGEPLEKWLEAVSPIAPKGSDQLHRKSCIDRLHFLAFAASEMGLEWKEDTEFSFRLGKTKGRSGRDFQGEVKSSFPGKRESEEPSHRLLEGNVGYLKIPKMDSGGDFRDKLHETMASFANTQGLIIDVRNNGGGSREALKTLLPYFLAKDAAPHVANVAAYRLQPSDAADDSNGFLSNRALWPANYKGWSDAERAAIEANAKQFKPDWKLPKKEFSNWHYMLISPADGSATHYSKPVIILQNSGCFSATDIFVGGFQGLPQVTLMGGPTGGGSGRSRTTPLPNSQLSVRLSSMASFRPNGQRYDGKGIPADVEQQPTLTDLIGQTDSVLEAARQRLAK